MKANELRIGNLIHNPIQNIDLRVTVDLLSRINYDYFNTQMNPKDKFQPIPLTEKWLLKFGFKELTRFTHDFEEIIYSKSIIIGSEDHCETLTISMPFKIVFIGDYLSDEDYTLNIDINNVHTLQNLYFALTNEELKITL